MATKTSDLTVGELVSRIKSLAGKLKLGKLVKWPLVLLAPFLIGVNVSNTRDAAQEAQFNEALKQLTPQGQPAPTVGTESDTWSGVTGAIGDVFSWLGSIFSWLGPAGVVIIVLGIALLVVVTKLLNMKVDPDTGKPAVKKPEPTTPDPTTPPATS